MVSTRRIGRTSLLVVFGLLLLLPVAGCGREVFVGDILKNPTSHWNKTVTVVGQVQSVTANPVGTTRGTYALLDDSSPQPLIVRSN